MACQLLLRRVLRTQECIAPDALRAMQTYCGPAPHRSGVYWSSHCSSMREFFFLGLTLLLVPNAVGQQHRLLDVRDPAYEYIVRLQRRGHLLELNPTATPYRHGSVARALAKVDTTHLGTTERHWLHLIRYAVRQTQAGSHRAAIGYAPEARLSLVNSDRKNLVRPLGDTLNAFYDVTLLSGWAEFGPAVAEGGVRHSRTYEDDPDGLDVALRLYGRSEPAYVGLHHRWLSVYLGRWNHHWGVHGEAATILSDNARSQDQLFLQLGGSTLSVTAILSELDSATDGRYFTGRAADDTVRAATTRRYLAAHRWDYRPSQRFAISLMESAIYSGPSSGLSLKYLNPMHAFAFVVDNSPKNDENNGFLAGMLWAQAGGVTVHGQLMIDDFNVQGIGNESVTFALAGTAVYALRAADVGVSLEAVSARAYNAPQVEGRYLYLQRGLATQFSDYVQAALWADLYLDRVTPGLRMQPRLTMLHQGERDIRQPFPSNDELLDNILSGNVVRTMRAALHVAYHPLPWLFAGAEGGVNRTGGETRLAGSVMVGLRFSLQTSLSL